MQDTQTPKLREEITTFLRRTGMKASTFGKKAVNNSELVKRLDMGWSVRLPTAERLRRFMASYDFRRAGEPGGN